MIFSQYFALVALYSVTLLLNLHTQISVKKTLILQSVVCIESLEQCSLKLLVHGRAQNVIHIKKNNRKYAFTVILVKARLSFTLLKP